MDGTFKVKHKYPTKNLKMFVTKDGNVLKLSYRQVDLKFLFGYILYSYK